MDPLTKGLTFSLLFLGILNVTLAQSPKKWNFGISANYGKDYYTRKYYTNDPVPGAVKKFKSNYSWGVGLVGERHLNSSWSMMIRLNYFTQDLANNSSCGGCGNTIEWYQFERHHWGSMGTGVRGYLRPNSPLKLFAEVGLQGDWFLGYTEAVNHTKSINWNAGGYHRFVPGLNAGIGIQWLRLGLLGEFQSNIARSFYKNRTIIDGVTYGTKQSIMRQSISLKATFLIIK